MSVEMDKNALYSIGEVSKLCNISRKTLYFYEELGLIVPDYVGSNNYRYYSRETLLLVPVIKYYKQMGLKLDELKALIVGNGEFKLLADQFREKVQEFEKIEHELFMRKKFITDWFNLLEEASFVLKSDMRDVSVKYMAPQILCAMPYQFDLDYREATINIEFTNFVESIDNAITGPVMIHYPSIEKKLSGVPHQVRVIQKAFKECLPEHSMTLPGGLYVSAYHLGAHEQLGETYEKILAWCENNQYQPQEGATERYVVDYWTTKNTSDHVTEVLIGVTRLNHEK